MTLVLSGVIEEARSRLADAGQERDALRAVFDDAAELIMRRVHERYPSTSGPRMQQALVNSARTEVDDPLARAWVAGRDALAEIKRAIAAHVGDELAESACGDPYRRLRYLMNPVPWITNEVER